MDSIYAIPDLHLSSSAMLAKTKSSRAGLALERSQRIPHHLVGWLHSLWERDEPGEENLPSSRKSYLPQQTTNFVPLPLLFRRTFHLFTPSSPFLTQFSLSFNLKSGHRSHQAAVLFSAAG